MMFDCTGNEDEITVDTIYIDYGLTWWVSARKT